MEERQGREMTEGYRTKPGPYGPLPDYACPRHQVRTYGVLKDGHLVAYTWLYQMGEMCLFSTILGHGDHLNAGVMYLLIAGTLRDIIPFAGTKYAMYNMHVSGTEGLRFFKEQMGFGPFWVNWQLADEPPFTKTPPRRPRPDHGAEAGPDDGRADRARRRTTGPEDPRPERKGLSARPGRTATP